MAPSLPYQSTQNRVWSLRGSKQTSRESFQSAVPVAPHRENQVSAVLAKLDSSTQHEAVSKARAEGLV